MKKYQSTPDKHFLPDYAKVSPEGKKVASLTDRTLGGFFWTFSGNVMAMVLRMLVMIILARLLNPTDFGVAGAALIVIGLAEIFGQLGIGPAIVQSRALTSRHVKVGFTLSTMIGIAVGALIALFAPLIAEFFRMPELKPVVRTLSLLFLITGLSVVSEAQLQREFQYKALAVSQVASFIFGYGVVGIGLAWSGWGVWALVYANIAGTVLYSLTLLIIKRKSIGFSLAHEEIRQLMNFGAGFSLARIANYGATQADNVVVGRWLGAEALGFYGRAYGLLMVPTSLFGKVADNVLFPAMAFIQDNKDQLRFAYLKIVAFIFMLTLPVSGLLILLTPELIVVLFGKKWLAVILPAQILAGTLVFRTAYKISDSLARATGAVYRRAWRQWVYVAAVFGGAWIGHFWGLGGVAYGVSCAILLNFLLMFHLSTSLIGNMWMALFRSFLRHAMVAILANSIVFGLIVMLRLFKFDPLVILIGGGCAFLLAILALWHISRGLFGNEGEWALSIIKSKVVGPIINAARTV